ncbi:hypothetical protein JTE90_025301 [Oedothorax gibbosus]|uniref:Uncharacterized protein n=1 Tax=Oedothorax gibbosus TaxID=931172 RepID=A0AAV6V7Z5_9ARAC|nr:hypothetical protein JTE90_025301 [Oedothorax gibbosus]
MIANKGVNKTCLDSDNGNYGVLCTFPESPGLDFVGFMLAVLEYDSLPPNFEVKVLSKTGAWRNTSNLILEVLNDPFSGSEFSKKPLQYQNLNVVQSDFLKNFSFADLTAAGEADVIFMMKTLNLLAHGAPQEGRLVQMFKEFVASLRPEAIIFCLDTEPSIDVLTQAIFHFPGKFLYGPRIHTAQLHTTFPEFNGHSPTSSARGVFFVWQKSPDTLSSNVSAINASIGTKSKDNMIRVDTSFNKSNVSSVENVSNTDVKDSNDLNLPWMELKSFWQRSSPKTKEVLKTLMLTDEESLEHINDLMLRKYGSSDKNSLKTFQNSGVEDLKTSKKEEVGKTRRRLRRRRKKEVGLNATEAVKSGGGQANVGPSQSELHDDLSMNNQRNIYNNYDMYSYTNGSPPSSCDSSFTCENIQFEEFLSLCKNTSSCKISAVDLGNWPCGSAYQELSEKKSKEIFMPEENLKLSFENKSIQTDGLLDSTTVPSSITALTNRIRQLTISLESASQQNVSSNGDFFPFTQPNGGCHNHSYCDDKPTCSKQSLNMGFNEQDSLPSYHRDAPCQKMGRNYSCHCSHNNRCMNCCFQHCCTQPIPRCSLLCCHQSEENYMAKVTSPNIVIPLHNISDDTLMQIVSILKSESKT